MYVTKNSNKVTNIVKTGDTVYIQHERFPEFFVVLNIKTNISANLSSKEKVTCLNDEGDIICFFRK
jgi:hypothetical protein